MEEAALVDALSLQNDVAVSAAAGGSNDILVEGKRDEYNDSEEVDGGADSAHALGKEGPGGFAHVAAAEPSRNESRAQPADHGVAEGEGEQGEGEGGDEGLAIVVEGIREDREGCPGEGEETEGLGTGERGPSRGRHGGRRSGLMSGRRTGGVR